MYEKITYYSRMSQTLHVPVPAAAPAGYQGPRDVVGVDAAGWWGMRAYSATYAAATGNAITIRDSVTLGTQVITVLADGSLDAASIATFLGGNPGTIVKFWDQSGAGNHIDVVLGDNGPDYNATGSPNSKPVGLFVSSLAKGIHSTNTLALSQPLSFSLVGATTANFTTEQIIYCMNNVILYCEHDTAINTLRTNISGGTSYTATASDSTFHSVLDVFNGGSSQLIVDGNAPGTGNVGAGSVNSSVYLGSLFDATTKWDGSFAELGLWTSDINASAAGLYNNQKTYWGY